MEAKIGRVTHYFGRISVAVLALTGTINVGDTLHIQGSRTDFTQVVASLEVEHEKVESAGVGADVALKVDEVVHDGDLVYKVT